MPTTDTTQSIVLNPNVRATFEKMLADGGRRIGDRWYSTYDSVTSNCTGQGWSDNRGPRHDDCQGWVNPGPEVKECRCPCHDEHRPSFYEAKAAACDHRHVVEVGMIEGDQYGCKVVRCERCLTRLNSHRSIYGCPKG